MKRSFKIELLILIFFILASLAIRSIYFKDHLNFSGDQAAQSTTVLELWRNKKFTLIGNPVDSFKFQGRKIFQGPAVYYMLGVFLIPARFDPVVSSYLFTIFCVLMIVPLYYGIKWLVNKQSALIMIALYSLLPYYINYTRFLWNPNFQLALLPLLIFLMGLFKQKKSKWTFFLLSVLLGILLQLHYQFIFILLGYTIYYFFYKKLKPIYLLIYICGLIVGFSPLIIFEFRNNFYNINTAFLILKNFNKVERAGSFSTPHYYLSISFLILLIVIGLINFKKITKKSFWIFFTIFTIFLFAFAGFRNFKKPDTAFWAPTSKWNYSNEERIYKIVKNENLKDYNITNLAYDNLSIVPKYLLKRDGVKINYDDYWHNRYLFVVSEGNYYLRTPAYEVRNFDPSKVLKKWKINSRFDMYLLERVK